MDERATIRAMAKGVLLHAGDRLTLACSCEVEVIVPTIIMMPRRVVASIRTRGATCPRSDHAAGRRVVIGWTDDNGVRVYDDPGDI